MDVQQLTIVADDNLVVVNGRPINMLLSLPDNVHAVQWGPKTRHIEYNDGTHNAPLKSLDEYQAIVTEHARLATLEDAPPTEQVKYNQLIWKRESRLSATDWLVLRQQEQRQLKQAETSLKEDAYQQLLAYRQALRDLPQRYQAPDDWQWPEPPPAVANALAKRQPQETPDNE